MDLKRLGPVCLAAVLAGCSGPPDEPTKDQMATAIQDALNVIADPRLGFRAELQNWEDLEVDCEPIEGPVKRLRCDANGKITLAGYRNGVQTEQGPQTVEPEWYFTFEKRGEGQWVAIDFRKKD